ncbi:Signal transducer and activator of transcription 5B isoform X2 [Oopsacas minuta]|uniref:Signal transducer and activator of transcription 5B isoform X2 n=1 Tax=Oopsacas minuta TaxID=111878 RepID=A0AAV7JAL8_9METZ|nr:Signal transducer and activator of transcription 5B isoform X2 [Oopsacas minuta]
MAYMGSPPGALWQNVKSINDQRILNSIRGLYGKHFPIEIRDHLAEWIESQRWHDLDRSVPVHQQEAQQLYGDMLTQLRNIKDHMIDFTDKMKWEDVLEKLQANFDSNPFNLVEQMQSILKTERQFLKEYQGANMSPQPSPAASHHSTNSPDPSKLVHSPPGSQLSGSNSHEAIGQSIQKICVMTHEAEGLLKSLEHQQEYFIIHINESHKLQAMVTHHSQHPVNPQVVQALRLKLQETELALNKEVENLQQNRITITQQFHMLLADLSNIIHLVVNDELVGWKRIQNQALGLDTSPPADDLLVVLQGWFETLAELLWRNKQFIKQYYRLKSQLPMNGTEIPEDYNQTVDNLIVFLLRNSFVVEKQPPQVLKTNTRFSCTVRLMVGGKLNIHMNPPEVIATIISEKQAKGLTASPDTLHANDISCGQMLNNKRAMEYNPNSQILSATFSNMSVKNIKRLEKKGSETVTDEKCAILLRSNIILPGSDVYFHVSTISLPVAVVVHGSQLSSAEGTMFWDKAFSDVNREPFVVPSQVPWLLLAKALNAYFFNTTGGALPEACIDYLWKKFPNVNSEDNGNSVITWQSFNKVISKRSMSYICFY